jgi:N-acetyl-anhydromuramyl-L-alanine amidase AmpD
MAIVPKGIIVHSMAEFLKMPEGPMGAHDFLKSVKLSVHGFIHPDGTYEKMIESPGKAAHAGASKYGDLEHLNNHFLGFELLVPGEHDFGTFSKAIESPGTYTDEQFNTAVEVCKHWMNQYDIPAEAVVRHSDVSGDDVRGAGKGKPTQGLLSIGMLSRQH